MADERGTALRGVEDALGDAIAKISSTYEICLIDAAGDVTKEAECKAIRDRSITYAKRVHKEMVEVVNREWPAVDA